MLTKIQTLIIIIIIKIPLEFMILNYFKNHRQDTSFFFKPQDNFYYQGKLRHHNINIPKNNDTKCIYLGQKSKKINKHVLNNMDFYFFKNKKKDFIDLFSKVK